MAPLYFRLYCVFTSALVSGQSTRYGLVGLEVNLKPDISGQPDQILWKHNGNKVVEFDGKEEQVYPSYADRVTLDWISAELHIRDLRYEDSGEYELEVFRNKNLFRSQFTVEVIDKVSKPTVSCQMNDGSSSDTPELQATLMCSADSRRPQSLMKFEWISNGNVQPGPKLTIPLRNKHDDKVYSCRVSNPLTQETANFTAKDCYPDESSNVPLVASICALVILFIAVVLGILFYKWKHKACFAKREGSDGRIDLSDENRPLFHRAPTYPSHQQLIQDERSLEGKVEDLTQFYESLKDKNTDNNKETVSPPVSPVRKPSFGQDSNNIPSNDTGDKDAEQLIEPTEETIPKSNSSDPAAGQDHYKDKPSDLQSPTASEQPVRKLSCGQDSNNLPSNDTGDKDAEQLIEPTEETIPEPNSSDSGTEQDPAAVQDHDEDEPFDLQSQTATEQPVKVKDRKQFYESLKDKNTDTNKETVSPPVSPVRKPSCGQDSNNLPSNDTGNKDAEQLKESTKETIPEPNSSDSDLQSPTASERPESVKADEDKESLPGTSALTATLLSPLTQNSPNMESDAAGKPKEDTDSDQVTGEPAEESDRESDSSDLEKINGPHDSSEEKQSSTIPEEKGSEITVHEQDSNLPQHETHTQEGEHQEMNKQVSGVRNESENDPEDVTKELTSSQLPQIPTEPENHNTDTAHTQADKEKGDKTRHESDASEEQSDNSTAEANQGEGESEAAENNDQCDQNKEQEVYSESKAVKTT